LRKEAIADREIARGSDGGDSVRFVPQHLLVLGSATGVGLRGGKRGHEERRSEGDEQALEHFEEAPFAG
jgi:hypothetical protein